MVVVGIMQKEEHHAQQAADMALSMINGLKEIILPFNNDIRIKVRVGVFKTKTCTLWLIQYTMANVS